MIAQSNMSGLWSALETARRHIQHALLGETDEHIDYCLSLVRCVLTNQGAPSGGTPTREIRKLIAQAIMTGLTDAFGAHYREHVDAAVFVRCETF